MLRWMVAAQHEALIEERAFNLYHVDDDRREKLGGHLYTFADVPDGVAFVSILDNDKDNPMHRVAFDLALSCRRPAPSRDPAVDARWGERNQRLGGHVAAT